MMMMNHARKNNLISSSSSTLSGNNHNNNDEGEGCLGGSRGGCLGMNGWLGGGGEDHHHHRTSSSAFAGGGGGEGGANYHHDNFDDEDEDDDPTLIVAKELNKLSLQEREKVYEDLHGVSMVEDESNQELVNKRLNDMKVELEKIPKSKKIAYLIAIEEFGEIGIQFVNDKSLLLMFLRADCWDSTKAAIRFVGWLDWKLKLYGRQNLCTRYVTLNQFDKISQLAIKSGLTQILPQRDTSGRTIIFDKLGHQTDFKHTRISILQLFWYIMMATVEDDIQAQRMGIVYILYSMNDTTTTTSTSSSSSSSSLSFSAEVRKLMYDATCMAPLLPVRIGSFHYCYNEPKIGPIISLIQRAIGSHLRVRFRSHKGNHTEVQYSLMTYGVPVHVLPVTTTGNMKKTHHTKWYQRRKIRDSTLVKRTSFSFSSSSYVGNNNNDEVVYGIDLPGRFDILLGKGPLIQKHMGNRRLQELISNYFQEYDSAGYGDKQLIAEKILFLLSPDSDSDSSSFSSSMATNQQQHVGATNGGGGRRTGSGDVASVRFLKRRNDGWWEPVTHKEAIEKVCHAFRSFRKGSNTKKEATIRTKSTTTTHVVDNRIDEKIVWQASFSSSSSITGGNSVTSSSSSSGTKRVKVDTQQSSNSSILKPLIQQPMWEEEEEEEGNYDGVDEGGTSPTTTTTSTVDDEWVLDLDRFNWGL